MHPILCIEMNNGNKIKIELYPQKAPNSINGLLWMVFKNGYDQMQIQRIAPGFVLQPWYDEMRMSEDYWYLVDGEFKENGFETNDLDMCKYAVGLAGDGKKTSSPSSFFIVLEDGHQDRLNGKFAGIGYVVEGFEEVERIVSVPLQDVASPEGVVVKEPVVPEIIKHVSVELNGYQYKEPKQFFHQFK